MMNTVIQISMVLATEVPLPKVPSDTVRKALAYT